MTKLPENAVCYKTTAPFTPENLPEKFRTNHTMKAGVWGEIQMQFGRLRITRFDAEGGKDGIGEEILQGIERAVFAPLEPHAVEFLEEGAFVVGFYRWEIDEDAKSESTR